MEDKQKHREKLGMRILQNSQNELYSYFPYLDGAFGRTSILSQGGS